MPWDYGSQHQLRRWILERPDEVTADLLRRNDTLRVWASKVEWLAETEAELRDEAWDLVGLPADSPQQARWWPSGGPVWDGVARVHGPRGAVGGIFVEAKGRAGELTGGGMEATAEKSIKTINSALAEVQAHLDVAPSDAWLRACYQPANRLAFLWYARHKCQPPAPVWLVSLYFLGERYPTAVGEQVGPGSEQDWEPIIRDVRGRMGLPAAAHDLSPWWIESFLPALEPPPPDPEPPERARLLPGIGGHVPMLSPGDMSDDELRVARATWEAERAERWARVSRLTGEAYNRAYAEYMEAKARAEAVAAEARRSGVRRRRAAASRPPTAESSSSLRFEVSPGREEVVAVADGPVRFPEPERRAFKRALRDAVNGLQVGPGQLLRGTFAGSLPAGQKTDVENRVLLNVGLREASLRSGFAFEHDRRPPDDWFCGYRYRAVPAGDPFSLWRPGTALCRWPAVALTKGLSAAAVWWAARRAREPRPDGPDAPPPAMLLGVTVSAPRALTLNELKAVADGVIAAAQWTAVVDPNGLARLTSSLVAAGVACGEDDVAALLTDSAGAGAGRCKDGLIARDGRVDPDDHLAVAGAVRVDRSAGFLMSAALYVARRR